MIELKTKRGEVHFSIDGTTSELLADLSICTGRVLWEILEDIEGLEDRNDLIKTVFEHILMVMEDCKNESTSDSPSKG